MPSQKVLNTPLSSQPTQWTPTFQPTYQTQPTPGCQTTLQNQVCLPLTADWSLHLKMDLKENSMYKSPFANHSWLLNYTVLTFLMNGYLYAEYKALQGMLGLPSCSDSQWQRIVGKLEEKVTDLAEWSCEMVREEVKRRKDDRQ